MLALPDTARCRSLRAPPRADDMRARSRRATGLSEVEEGRENVFAFIPGTWMKELIEMAVHIEASQTQYFEELMDKDALERARQIKL